MTVEQIDKIDERCRNKQKEFAGHLQVVEVDNVNNEKNSLNFSI